MPQEQTPIVALGFLALLAFFFAYRGLTNPALPPPSPQLHGFHLERGPDGALRQLWTVGPLPLEAAPAIMASTGRPVPAAYLRAGGA